jgi:RNA polymerase sigma factor (sigma-70 family)
MHQIDIEQLVEQCAKGDARAQKVLFEKYGPKLLAVCNRYMGDTDEAQDVFQDGFVKIFEKIGSYKGDGSFEGWMRRIIVNTALDAIRRNQKLRLNVAIDTVYQQPSTEQNVLSDLAAKDLMKILQQLPLGYRTVFNLYAIEGYSHKEIAEQLEITVSTSKSQFSRAKGLLREILEKQNIAYES